MYLFRPFPFDGDIEQHRTHEYKECVRVIRCVVRSVGETSAVSGVLHIGIHGVVSPQDDARSPPRQLARSWALSLPPTRCFI